MLILKQLRRKKSINQSDLAKAIGVSLRTIQLYEKENANIPIKNLNKLADYFDLGIDQLYAQEVNEEVVSYDKQTTRSKKGHTIRKLAPGKYLLSVPLITEDSLKSYLEHISDTDFLKELPCIGFVIDQVSISSYLAFEISNSSMDNGLTNRIPQKSIVLAKQVSSREVTKRINEDNSYWVIALENDLMCKEITAYNKKEKSITCHSLNRSPEYQDFEVLIDEVKAFFRVVRKQLD